MKYLLLSNFFWPFLGSFLIGVFGRLSEKLTAKILTAISVIFGVSVSLTLLEWVRQGMMTFSWKGGNIYQNGAYSFPFALHFDLSSAVFLTVSTYLYFLVAHYAKYYMHRESAYARFFATILMFLGGLTFLFQAGTVDLLFIGWEIVGISSFLLINFYRHRLTSSKNSFLVYCVYRFCDLGILLGAWMAHMLWHQSPLFAQFSIPASAAIAHSTELLMLSFLIFLAACGKSAQFPFSFWLPRAMEGPTPSSAIFYGALSVHLGVFLLLRLYPVWQLNTLTKVFIGAWGLMSAVFASISSRSQSNIKGQIAYSSAAQVGLMFFELALGFPKFALMHFVANAGLRCYQLLLSPSVVVATLQRQAFIEVYTQSFSERLWNFLPRRLRASLYVFSLEESFGFLLIKSFVLSPLKKIGQLTHYFDQYWARWVGFSLGIVVLVLARLEFAQQFLHQFVLIGSILSVLSALSALHERKNAQRAWNAVAFSLLCFSGAVLLVEKHSLKDVILFSLGTIPPWMLGSFILKSLAKKNFGLLPLTRHLGLEEKNSKTAFVFFLCFLAMSGFPIGPAFIAEDAYLHHLVGKHQWLSFIFMIAFVLNGAALARLVSLLFFGPTPQKEKTPHAGIKSAVQFPVINQTPEPRIQYHEADH